MLAQYRDERTEGLHTLTTKAQPNPRRARPARHQPTGRKSYLLAGSDAGGDRAATIYSLIGTAKLDGLDPQAYLHYVLERIADHAINRIDELLSWNVIDAFAESEVLAA